MHILSHAKSVNESLCVGCLHKLRGTVFAIANELAAEILCDGPFIRACEAHEQSRFEFRMTERDEQATRLLSMWQLIKISAVYFEYIDNVY